MVARFIVKSLVIAFCLWHMAAVGVYSLISTEGYPILEWLDSKRSIFRTYMLTTSQWQRWNLFSPDPLRRVLTLRIDLFSEEDELWHEIAEVSPWTVSFARRATELKTIRRMEDEESFAPLRERYLREFCTRFALPGDASLRLRKRYFVVPRPQEPWSTAQWAAWEPEWQEEIDVGIFCDETLQPSFATE